MRIQKLELELVMKEPRIQPVLIWGPFSSHMSDSNTRANQHAYKAAPNALFFAHQSSRHVAPPTVTDRPHGQYRSHRSSQERRASHQQNIDQSRERLNKASWIVDQQMNVVLEVEMIAVKDRIAMSACSPCATSIR